MKLTRRFSVWLKSFVVAEPPAPESVPLPGLVIAGVEVVAIEGDIPEGAVRFVTPGHPWNPTKKNVLVCDFVTYVSLASRPDSQRRVAMMVQDAYRALRAKARAEARRARRLEKRRLRV